MAGRDETDWAARRAAITAGAEARRAEIWAGFHAHVETVRDVEERGVTPAELARLTNAWFGPGRRSMTVAEAEAHRDRLLRQVTKDELLDLDVLAREKKLAEDETGRRRVGEPDGRDELVGGLPYMKADYEAAGKLHKAEKMTVAGIEKRRELKTKRAYRIYRQYNHGAVIYDDVGLRPGPGYRWDPVALDQDPPGYKLIRK